MTGYFLNTLDRAEYGQMAAKELSQIKDYRPHPIYGSISGDKKMINLLQAGASKFIRNGRRAAKKVRRASKQLIQ